MWAPGEPTPSEPVAEGLFTGIGACDTLLACRARRVSMLRPVNTNRRPGDDTLRCSLGVHLPVSGWRAPARAGSRKRITCSDAGTRPSATTADGGSGRLRCSWPARCTTPYRLRTPAVHTPYTDQYRDKPAVHPVVHQGAGTDGVHTPYTVSLRTSLLLLAV